MTRIEAGSDRRRATVTTRRGRRASAVWGAVGLVHVTNPIRQFGLGDGSGILEQRCQGGNDEEQSVDSIVHIEEVCCVGASSGRDGGRSKRPGGSVAATQHVSGDERNTHNCSIGRVGTALEPGPRLGEPGPPPGRTLLGEHRLGSALGNSVDHDVHLLVVERQISCDLLALRHG